MFNVGDKVLILNGQSGIRAMKNQIGQIRTVSVPGKEWSSLENDPFTWKNEWLELVPEKEIDITESDLTDLL